MVTLGKYKVDAKRNGKVLKDFNLIHIYDEKGYPLGNIMISGYGDGLFVNIDGKITFNLNGRKISEPDTTGWVIIK